MYISFFEKHNVNYNYHSTQIDIDQEKHGLLGFVYRTQMQIDNDNLYQGDKYGLENEIHITVCYGLKNECDYFKLRKQLKNIGPIDLKFTKISKFPANSENPYDVIKINVFSEKLIKVNSLIRKEFEVFSSYPVYKPHLTIAYVKPNSCDYLLNTPVNSEYTCNNIKWSHIDNYKLDMPLI